VIARSWSAETSPERAADYVRLLKAKVLPVLAAIEGHRGAYVLERVVAGERAEILVITLWESMDAVRKFAGDEPDRAVVTEEVRSILTRFDQDVKHYEVLLTPQSTNP
jgi:heme-degrading monooxygenase HmoA